MNLPRYLVRINPAHLDSLLAALGSHLRLRGGPGLMLVNSQVATRWQIRGTLHQGLLRMNILVMMADAMAAETDAIRCAVSQGTRLGCGAVSKAQVANKAMTDTPSTAITVNRVILYSICRGEWRRLPELPCQEPVTSAASNNKPITISIRVMFMGAPLSFVKPLFAEKP